MSGDNVLYSATWYVLSETFHTHVVTSLLWGFPTDAICHRSSTGNKGHSSLCESQPKCTYMWGTRNLTTCEFPQAFFIEHYIYQS